MFEERLTRRQFGIVSLLAMATGSKVFPGDDDPQDEDYLAVGDESDLEALNEDGWTCAGSCWDEDSECTQWPGESPFVSLTKGGQNIILVRESAFVERWIAAHDECVANPPKDKAGRIKVFRKHLYGEDQQCEQ